MTNTNQGVPQGSPVTPGTSEVPPSIQGTQDISPINGVPGGVSGSGGVGAISNGNGNPGGNGTNGGFFTIIPTLGDYWNNFAFGIGSVQAQPAQQAELAKINHDYQTANYGLAMYNALLDAGKNGTPAQNATVARGLRAASSLGDAIGGNLGKKTCRLC